MCRCKEGLVRREGVCVELATKSKPTKAPEKKKKKKSSSKGNQEEEEEEIDRREFPWYFTVGPLACLFLTVKYVRPNMVTGAGLVLVMVLIAIRQPE